LIDLTEFALSAYNSGYSAVLGTRAALANRLRSLFADFWALIKRLVVAIRYSPYIIIEVEYEVYCAASKSW
jgi:hypothetical protein